MFCFMYMLYLSKTNKYTCIPLSHLPSCKYHYGLFLCLGYVCILLVLDKNIHIPWNLFLNWKINFHDFQIFDEPHWLFSWICYSQMLVHSHYFCLLMILFYEHIFELYRFRVSIFVYLVCFMIYIWFGFMFEGSLTSFSKITLSSYLFFNG